MDYLRLDRNAYDKLLPPIKDSRMIQYWCNTYIETGEEEKLPSKEEIHEGNERVAGDNTPKESLHLLPNVSQV